MNMYMYIYTHIHMTMYITYIYIYIYTYIHTYVYTHVSHYKQRVESVTQHEPRVVPGGAKRVRHGCVPCMIARAAP